ncbi:MAG: dihydrofolate reductase [Candidatus Cryptobacteroides sp.]
MEICVIAAVAADGAIGRGNRLLWHLPEDLKNFKATTLGCPIIMGRRTFESIGMPLPGRKNIIVSTKIESRRLIFTREGKSSLDALVCPDLTSALALASEMSERCFIIGGARLYAEALPLADRLYITHIDATAEDADAFFPPIDPKLWKEVSCSEDHTDAATGLAFRYSVYGRV